MQKWEHVVIEEALGEDAASVLPEAIRLVELRARFDEAQLIELTYAAAIENIKSGTLKALVQTGEKRWPDLPDVPTLAEAGLPNAEAETFQALFAPAGTPKEIVDRLAKDTVEILRRPDVQARLQSAGLGLVAFGPEALATRVARDVATWKDVIEKTGLKVE